MLEGDSMCICNAFQEMSGSDDNFLHNFIHNSSTWRVVIGGWVMVDHPSTNHNSPYRRVVYKIVHIVVTKIFPKEWVRRGLRCRTLFLERSTLHKLLELLLFPLQKDREMSCPLVGSTCSQYRKLRCMARGGS